jgi:hypothetical protein
MICINKIFNYRNFNKALINFPLRMARTKFLIIPLTLIVGLQISGLSQTQIAKLKASDGAAEEFFGNSVAISEDIAIVGSHFEDANGWGAGAAYLFRRNGNNWSEEQKIIGSGIDDYDFFGTSVDIAGNVAVIGSPADQGTGTAYVFRWNGTNWVEEKILQASDGLSNELFGQSVAINRSADMIVVGAPMDGLGEGSAYIFTYNGSTWIEQQNIYANDGIAGDKFGFSVSISENGNAILIGETGSNYSGKAHVFVKDGNTWVRVSKLLPTNGSNADGFGPSVSINDNFAVVGSRYDDVDFIDCGSAHIFKRDGNNWTWLYKISADDRHENQRFGYVGISSDLIIVGATHDNQNGLDAGAAYIFKYNGKFWTQAAKILPVDGFAEDWFGSSVKINGTLAIIGSPYDNDNGSNSGSAYIYDLQNLTGLDSDPPTEIRSFYLEQNYPNPFNPTTLISYQLPIKSQVTLKVYDMLGIEVASLVNDEIAAGAYEITWNPFNLPSGVYLYRIQAGSFIQTRKMILMK